MKKIIKKYKSGNEYYLICIIFILLLSLPSLAFATLVRYEVHLTFQDRTEASGYFWFSSERGHFSEWNIETKSSEAIEGSYTYSSDDECGYPVIGKCREYMTEFLEYEGNSYARLVFYEPCWKHLCEYQRQLNLWIKGEIDSQLTRMKLTGIRYPFPSFEAEGNSIKRRALYGGIFNTSLMVPGPTTLILFGVGLVAAGLWNKQKALAYSAS